MVDWRSCCRDGTITGCRGDGGGGGILGDWGDDGDDVGDVDGWDEVDLGEDGGGGIRVKHGSGGVRRDAADGCGNLGDNGGDTCIGWDIGDTDDVGVMGGGGVADSLYGGRSGSYKDSPDIIRKKPASISLPFCCVVFCLEIIPI